MKKFEFTQERLQVFRTVSKFTIDAETREEAEKMAESIARDDMDVSYCLYPQVDFLGTEVDMQNAPMNIAPQRNMPTMIVRDETGNILAGNSVPEHQMVQIAIGLN